MSHIDQNGLVHPDACDAPTPARMAHIEGCKECQVSLSIDGREVA